MPFWQKCCVVGEENFCVEGEEKVLTFWEKSYIIYK